VVAHEWLDNVPCHVVQVDEAGVPRMVHVDPASGVESLGLAVDGAGVPPELGRWLATWWPLSGEAPGTRAEVGTARDRAWADVVARLGRGIAVAVDHGHLRDDRPPAGSLRCYRHGWQVPVRVDGSCDVTAGVAVDAVAAAAGARLHRQRDVLTALGLDPALPPSSTADQDPPGYLRALSEATRAADLLRPGGLGDFHWLFSSVGGVDVPLG
jgi:SAM-dependent MidA family methyltransferase